MTAHENGLPTVAEIAALTARLRRLSVAGRDADPAERAAFLADKDALLARIIDAPDQPDVTGDELVDCSTADEAKAVARAAAGGYVMVGPSARTWAVDPETGVPTGPVSEAEHRLVRDLTARERLDGAESGWLRCTDGGDEFVTRVVPVPQDIDEPLTHAHGGPTEHTHEPEVVNEPPQGLDSDGSPPFPLPAVMLDGVEERCTAPARPDDPAQLAARLADLRARAAETAREVAAAGGPFTRWQTVSAAQAARELVARGADPTAARAAVAGYLRDTSERVGAPADEWGLDQGDIDAIATAHQLPTAAGIAAGQAVDDADDADDAARAAQLTRWHTDDHTVPDEAEHVHDDAHDDGHRDADGMGWTR